MTRGSKENLPTKSEVIAGARHRLINYFGGGQEEFSKEERIIATYYMWQELKNFGFKPSLRHLSEIMGHSIPTVTRQIQEVERVLAGGPKDFTSRGIRFCILELMP